jgi:integrase/recombinase XerD
MRDRILLHLLFHLGCRVSEALAITVEDIDFVMGTVTIRHLKAGIRLSCPHCGSRLGRTHTFCPKCGTKVEKALIQEQEHRRVRALQSHGLTCRYLLIGLRKDREPATSH